MPELSLQNIDQITRDISGQEITFSHLIHDLIDHVCCDVEYEMQSGADFAEAYRRVKQKMGSRRLKEIQEETLFAVDTKYRKMKNTMKISGIAGTVLFGFAVMFKIQHWPLAGVMMTFGAMILTFAFLPSSLNVLWKETHNTKRLLLFLSAYLTGAFFITGTLFKIQHWPLAGAMLALGAIIGTLLFIPALLANRLYDPDNSSKKSVYILGASGSVLYIAGLFFKIQHWPFATLILVAGMILLVVVALPLYTIRKWKGETNIKPSFLFLIIGSLLIIIPGALINLNLQHSYQKYYYPNNYKQNELYKYLVSNNQSIVSRYHDSLNYPEIDQLHSKTTGVLNTISNIQKMMVQESERESGKTAVSIGQEILYRELSWPMDPGPAKAFLLPGCSTREELNSSLADYTSYLTTIISAEDMIKYKKMLATDTFLPSANKVAGDMSLLSGLHSLEIMKNGLLTVESCLLRDITRH